MIFQNSGLKDQVIVITGGSRGIGREMVNAFAAEGAKVHFIYHNNEAMAQSLVTEAEIKQWPVYAHQADVSQLLDCQKVIQNIFEQEQQINVLINNSGIVRDNLLVGLTEDDIQAVIQTNLMGSLYMTQTVAPFMMSQRQGHILNMSSVAGLKAGRGQANYAASKGAIEAFTRAMAVELAPRKIRVNAIAPGVIETDISKDVRELASPEILSKILLNRFGKPEEVAYLALFLSSQYAQYITGQVFTIDGGFKMA